METCKNDKLGWFVVFCVFCLAPLSARAGVPSKLVEPGGVEIPVVLNVWGPEEPNDVNDVKAIITETNRILEPANVQLAVHNVNTGITQFGDGDSRLTQEEHAGALLASLIEMQWPSGPGRGIKINIADDIWVEKPEQIFWHDIFYPVAFLESSTSPVQMGQTLAREIGVTAGLPASEDPGNLMHPDGAGTSLDESQSAAILDLAKLVGYVRSPLAEGYAPDVLDGLRYKRPGAPFFSEGWALRGDPRGDVLIDDASGIRTGGGGPDLEAFIAKSGRIGASDVERTLTLKFYFGVPDLPTNTYRDTYLRVYNYKGDGSDGNETPIGDPFETFDAVIGIGLPAFGPPYAGVINLLAGRDFIRLPGIEPVVEHDRDRTKVKAEIPFGLLRPHLSDDLLGRLNNGKGIEVLAAANSVAFNPSSGFIFQDDFIETIKIMAIPRPVPQILALSSLGEPAADAATGFTVRSVKPVTLDPIAGNLMRDYLKDLFGGSIALAEDGTRNSKFVNFYDTSDSRGYFTADNGHPDDTFPIDPPESPAASPAGGDDDDNFATQVTAVVHLTKGLHIVGAPGEGAAVLEIGGVEVGFAYSRGPADHNDTDNANGSAEPWKPPFGGDSGGSGMRILTRRDWAFEVQTEGFYPLQLRTWMGTGGASLELTQVLPNGTRLLLGDVAGGGPRVFVPF